MKKILIIQTSFIGDVVLATALVEKLYNFYPDAKIDMLVRKGNETLLTGHPYLHKVWVWNKKKHKNRNLARLAVAIRNEEYDCVVNPHRFASSGMLTLASGAKERIGFDKNLLSFGYTHKLPHIISEPYAAHPVHETERNQTLIAHLTDSTPAIPALYPTPNDYEKVEHLQGQPYIYPAGQ